MSETRRQIGNPPSLDGSDTPRPAVRSVGFEAGTRVGEYRVLRPLGQGGMGCVYEALDTELGRTVALKSLLPGAAVDAANRERMVVEARALAAVCNDHVVTVYRVGVHDGIPYLVMELLAGESLAVALDRGLLPFHQVLKIGRELANGLSAAHRAGIVHRDVKPDNVILDVRQGRAVLVDFGLASAPDGGGPVGTPGYMAPEQLRGEPLDGRTDLFALGAVLYRACTGALPVAVGSISDWQDELLSPSRPTPPDQVNPAVPPPLARLIDRLLAKNPADRPATAAEVEGALRDILLRAADRSPIAPAPPASSRRRRFAAVAAVVAVAATGVVLAVALGGGTPAPDPRPTEPPAAEPPPIRFPDGRVMADWRALGGRSDAWSMTDDEVLTGTPKGEDQVVFTNRDYADFVLEFEFRWAGKGGHTGVLLRAKEEGPGRLTCLMLDIADDEHYAEVHGRPLGKQYTSGGLFQFPKPEQVPNKPVGEWNQVRVEAAKFRVTVDWNGVRTFDQNLVDPAHGAKVLPALARPAGAIGLMARGHQAIQFRHFTIIEIRD